MALQDKYRAVLNLGQELNIQDGFVEEKDGKLHIGGVAATQYEKNLLWAKIKSIGGDNPSDVAADIKVATTDYYHKHVVQAGESLSKIAKHYYEDPMKYKEIFAANTGVLDNPDLIHPGQELVIPFT